MNNGTGSLRSYLQTIGVIVILADVIYMITQTVLERTASSDARNASDVPQTVLTGGEVSEALLIAEFTGLRLEELNGRQWD